MLLALAPGLRVVRRGHDHLQVGLYDDRRVVLPRSAATAHVLARIREGRPVDLDEPDVAATVTRLVAAGCALPGRLVPRSERRAQARVAVVGALGPDPRPLLAAAGLPTWVQEPADTDVALLLCRGEPARERLDPWLRHLVPHLVVRVVDAGVVVGPFVLPGRTPCLRCLDAHHADADPDHLPVLARYVAASGGGEGREDVEPVLLHLALTWAVRDLLTHVDGLRPSTCARTVRLGPAPHDEVRTTWSRHPECGCCWPVPAQG